MMRRIKSLIGFDVLTTGGRLGTLEDVYIEETSWLVRYLVVLVSRPTKAARILVPCEQVTEVDVEGERIHVETRLESAMESPAVELQSYSPRAAGALRETSSVWVGFSHVFQTPTAPEMVVLTAVKTRLGDDMGASLFSFGGISHHIVEAVDGEIGQLDNVLIDCAVKPWSVQYIEVNVNRDRKQKVVPIPVTCVDRFSMDEGKIHVYLYLDTITMGPESSDSVPVGKVLEEEIYRHYGWPQSWV